MNKGEFDMAKFRKKPVVIEAVQWTGDNQREIVKFCREMVLQNTPENPKIAFRGRSKINPSENQVLIRTLEGVMEANAGDWIIKGVKGEFYPCKPDIFEASYEPIDENKLCEGDVLPSRTGLTR